MTFKDWLIKQKGFSEQNFENTWKNIENIIINETRNTNIKVLYKYALFTMTPENRVSLREERKLQCKLRFLDIRQKSPKLKRSECVKILANEMNVKKDCIRVYLRELGL